MNETRTNIVADGSGRLRDAKDYPALKRRIETEVRARLSAEAGASWWRRLRLEARILGEVRKELRKHFPPSALHLAGATR